MTNLTKAIKFAEQKHKGQKYGEHDYMKHLNDVSRVILDARIDDDTVHCVAYLHDVLEDTETSESEIEKEFGVDIAKYSVLLTNSTKSNHVLLIGKAIPSIVKVADRIANQEACIKDKNMSLAYKYVIDYRYVSKLNAGEALNYRLKQSYNILYKMLRKEVCEKLGISRQAFSQWVLGKSFPGYHNIEGLAHHGINIFKYVK